MDIDHYEQVLGALAATHTLNEHLRTRLLPGADVVDKFLDIAVACFATPTDENGVPFLTPGGVQDDPAKGFLPWNLGNVRNCKPKQAFYVLGKREV